MSPITDPVLSGSGWLANLRAWASSVVAGVLDVASNAEAWAGTLTTKVLTPASLAYVLPKLTSISFAGSNGAGPCTVTGLKVGDVVISVTGAGLTTVGNQSAKFASTVTVADQVAQTDAGNLSTNVYVALVLRKS